MPPKPAGQQPGKAKPVNALVRRTRAAQFLVEAAAGATQKEIAERHGLSVVTVKAELKWAEQQGFFERADEAIRNRLIPRALDAVEKTLIREAAEGTAETAMKLLFGVRVLSTNGPTRTELQNADQAIDEAEMTWEKFTLTRRTTNAQQTAAPSGAETDRDARSAGDEALTVEGEIVREESEPSGLQPEREKSGGDGEDAPRAE